MLRFDGRVALITGAGRGLGREYALLLASRGARVVVNDLGADRGGIGNNSQPVDEVVSTIRSKGGVAVPNYNSVEDGEKVVKTAIDNFGRIDILVNNAGIIRDRSIAKLTDQDWDLVHRVHLRGAFMTTRAAWPYMKKQKYGRVILTTSPSGLYGNFGQANYSAAKLGLVGFCNTLAKEGEKYNIFCNTVAPTAASRLTEDIIPAQLSSMIAVEHISPIVAYMCHESCTDNGAVIETAGGWAGKVRLQKSSGVAMRVANKPLTIEDVRDNWTKICDMSQPLYHTSSSESMNVALAAVEEKLNPSTSSGEDESLPNDVNKAIGFKFQPKPYTYTSKDVILYALGVGASVSQEDTSELKFLYEGHDEFSAIPSYAVIPAQSAMTNLLAGGFPGLEINPAKVLHGEQYVELKKTFPTSGTLHHHAVVRDILDKKKGAIIIIDVDSNDDDGEPVCFNQFTIFVGGAGGFGGKRSSPHAKLTVATPDRRPDASLAHKTLTSQAALYRLNGDLNPLHIDPDFAAMGGFSTPILHGLCSYGIATRHVLKQYCGNDVSRIRAIKTRFNRPVIPGQTIQTDMWKEGDRVFFTCKAVESGDVVLTGGYVDLNSSPSPSQAQSAADNEGGDSSGLQSSAVFSKMQDLVSSSGPELIKKVNAIYVWNILKDGKVAAQWTADLKNSPGAIYPGQPKKQRAGCTITLTDEDYVALANGDLNPQQAFFEGKLKITGNIMLAQKLQELFNQQSKL